MGPARQVVVLGFTLIQAVLIGRLLLDLRVLPRDVPFVDVIVPASNALATPITAIAERLGGQPHTFGTGFDPAILTALVGWSLVEMVFLLVIGRTR